MYPQKEGGDQRPGVAGGDPLVVCCICSGDGVGGRPLAPAAAPEAEKWEPCVAGRKHVKASHGIGEDGWPS